MKSYEDETNKEHEKMKQTNPFKVICTELVAGVRQRADKVGSPQIHQFLENGITWNENISACFSSQSGGLLGSEGTATSNRSFASG